MAEKYSYGLKTLKFGEPTGTMTMPALMEEKFRTYKNSCEFTEDDTEKKSEYCDQSDDPFLTILTKGQKRVKVSTFDYDSNVLSFLKGGTVVNGQWFEPSGVPQLFKAVEIVTDTGLPFSFPKMQIFAKFNAKMTKDGVKLLEIEMLPMAPEAGKGAVIIGEKIQ